LKEELGVDKSHGIFVGVHKEIAPATERVRILACAKTEGIPVEIISSY